MPLPLEILDIDPALFIKEWKCWYPYSSDNPYGCCSPGFLHSDHRGCGYRYELRLSITEQDYEDILDHWN